MPFPHFYGTFRGKRIAKIDCFFKGVNDILFKNMNNGGLRWKKETWSVREGTMNTNVKAGSEKGTPKKEVAGRKTEVQ